MRILFLTSRFPFPPVGGDKLRTFNFIKYLKNKHQLTLVSFIENESELDAVPSFHQYFDKLITIKLPKVVSYVHSFSGLFSSRPLQIHYYYSKKMKKAIREELKEGYDVIFSHLIRMAQYLPEDPAIHKVIDFTDAMSLNYLRSKKYRKGLFSLINFIEAERVLKYELGAIEKADISIFISEIDANCLKNSRNQHKIKIVANGVDFERFSFYQGSYDENQLSFVGNMRTFPNTDAAIYFVREIFPRLQKLKPALKFYIVGTEPNRAVARLHNGKNVFVTGFVDSVIPYITNSVAFVAPMRVGAGVQNKILEAMALGTPIVTTSIGAEGLDGNMLLIGNTAEEITQHVLKLIENQEYRKEKAARGREYIEKNFRWEEVLSKLDECLELRGS